MSWFRKKEKPSIHDKLGIVEITDDASVTCTFKKGGELVTHHVSSVVSKSGIHCTLMRRGNTTSLPNPLTPSFFEGGPDGTVNIKGIGAATHSGMQQLLIGGYGEMVTHRLSVVGMLYDKAAPNEPNTYPRTSQKLIVFAS